MKRRNIVNFIHLLQRDILIYDSTLKQLVTAEKQAEYRDMITHSKAKLSFYEESLRLKDEKKALKAKDKEPKEKITVEYDKDTPHIFRIKQDSLKCIIKDMKQTEKIIQPSDNKTEEKKDFDFELNKKFAIFNGWEFNDCLQTISKPFYLIHYDEAKQKLNYLEDPKLIQETIDNINSKILGEFKTLTIQEQSEKIDYIKARDSGNLKSYFGRETAYNEGYEAGRKQPKSKEFLDQIQKEHELEIKEAERLAWQAARETIERVQCGDWINKFANYYDYKANKVNPLLSERGGVPHKNHS